MANFESADKEEKAPLSGTMEMLGVKAEEAESSKAEAPESYRDVGEQRLAAAAESVRSLGTKVGGFMSRAWGKVKSFGSATMETGKSALYYTLAAPEMIGGAASAAREGVTNAAEAAREGIIAGTEFIGDKAVDAVEGAKNMGAAAASRAFEGAVTAYDKTKEGAVYVSEKGKAAYEGAVNFGKEKYAGLQQRAEDARGIFQAAVNEARRRRQERLAREQGNREYEEALNVLRAAQEKVREMESRFGGSETSAA